MNKSFRRFFLSGSILLLPSVLVMAQETPITTTSRDFEKTALPAGPVWQAGVNLGYVGGSTTKFMGAHLADSDAFNVSVEAGTRVALNEQWSLNLGLVSDNFFLDQVAGAPLPADINTLRLNTALSYRLNAQWTFTALVSPALYRFEDVGSDELGISGGAIATFQQNPSLTWSFGILGSPDSDVPVLPIIGVSWLINDHYTLEVGMPKTRLTYKLKPDWSLYTGLDVAGTTFRTSNDLGAKTGFPVKPGSPSYDNALANYLDIRLGVGTSYDFGHGLRGEIETGFSVYREVNYKYIDQSVEFDPAPYVRVGLSLRF